MQACQMALLVTASALTFSPGEPANCLPTARRSHPCCSQQIALDAHARPSQLYRLKLWGQRSGPVVTWDRLESCILYSVSRGILNCQLIGVDAGPHPPGEKGRYLTNTWQTLPTSIMNFRYCSWYEIR